MGYICKYEGYFDLFNQITLLLFLFLIKILIIYLIKILITYLLKILNISEAFFSIFIYYLTYIILLYKLNNLFYLPYSFISIIFINKKHFYIYRYRYKYIHTYIHTYIYIYIYAYHQTTKAQ